MAWARYFLNEVKRYRSLKDVRILYDQKLTFLFSRLTGRYYMERDAPPSLQIEPASHCNVNCVCCSIDKTGRKRGYMDIGLFRDIITEASGIGIKRVHLYLHGEPLLHPRIVEMIAHTKSKGLGITMHTNGMLMSGDKAQGILDSGVDSGDYILFSILGHTKETHEKVMRGVDHERVKKNLKGLIDLRRKKGINGPIIEVIFYRMPENASEESAFRDYWSGIVDNIHPIKAISSSFANYPGNGYARTATCKNIWERMVIYWNGDATVCCADVHGEHVIGNVREKSIKELWNCGRLVAYRKLHREKKIAGIKMCSRCDL